MSSQNVPILVSDASVGNNEQKTKAEYSFDAFNFNHGEDANIRWLSRPGPQYLNDSSCRDAEKFCIKFDAENFQPHQIKIYIMNRQLTISGVYEERSEGRYMQKQFEKSFDIPDNAAIEAMAAYITPTDMLVVQIPLNIDFLPQPPKLDLLSVNANAANLRRLSFSLDKFNTMNNPNLMAAANNSANLFAPPANQQVRRTSITKTMTTTTSSAPGLTGLPPEAAALLNSGDIAQATSQTYTTERRKSGTIPQQIVINEPPATPPVTATNPTTTRTILNESDLASLGIEIPPELLAVGGTITIQKRRVSVTRTADPAASRPGSTSTVTNAPAASSSITKTTSTNASSPPAPVTTNVQPTSQANTSARRGSLTVLTSNERKMFTLDEFLENKTWNPSITDGTDGQKILCMRLAMKPGVTASNLRITLNGLDLRVEVIDNAVANTSGQTNEQSYRQITLFPTCDVKQIKTTLKNDGFLHIQVPIQI